MHCGRAFSFATWLFPGSPSGTWALFKHLEKWHYHGLRCFCIARIKGILDRNKLIVILEGNSISIREVKIVRSERDVVIISSGIEDGDRVVTTPLSNAIEGMKVEVYQD